MKKNVGSLLALYPMPVTVIGAMNENAKINPGCLCMRQGRTARRS